MPLWRDAGRPAGDATSGCTTCSPVSAADQRPRTRASVDGAYARARTGDSLSGRSARTAPSRLREVLAGANRPIVSPFEADEAPGVRSRDDEHSWRRDRCRGRARSQVAPRGGPDATRRHARARLQRHLPSAETRPPRVASAITSASSGIEAVRRPLLRCRPREVAGRDKHLAPQIRERAWRGGEPRELGRLSDAAGRARDGRGCAPSVCGVRIARRARGVLRRAQTAARRAWAGLQPIQSKASVDRALDAVELPFLRLVATPTNVLEKSVQIAATRREASRRNASRVAAVHICMLRERLMPPSAPPHAALPRPAHLHISACVRHCGGHPIPRSASRNR